MLQEPHTCYDLAVFPGFLLLWSSHYTQALPLLLLIGPVLAVVSCHQVRMVTQLTQSRQTGKNLSLKNLSEWSYGYGCFWANDSAGGSLQKSIAT